MGATALSVRRHTYQDSVFLMRVANALERERGVIDVAALMATPANKDLLRAAGFAGGDVDTAAADDLVVGVTAETQDEADAALARLDALLRGIESVGRARDASGWDEALAMLPGANLALVSVPGDYAASEVEHAIDRGLHVFCFSSSVAVADEVRLKRSAQSRGLLLMGPDCGTSIIAGKGLGFANAVRRGPVGIVGGSGTGMQAVACLVHAGGSGISHAIGSGSRDLTDDVGGITTFAALDALSADSQTAVIVVVSKTPGTAALARLEDFIRRSQKPVVTCFLGGSTRGTAATFEEAARQALAYVGAAAAPNGEHGLELRPVGGRAVGLFAGGSVLHEARAVLEAAGASPDRYQLVDMGSEELTRGRPHPMIDARLRAERIIAAGEDASVAIVLLDVVLGRGAARDPAGDLAPAILDARSRARRGGRELVIVASVIGTDLDPQDRAAQVAVLESAGVTVAATSAAAAAFVAEALR